MSRIVLILTHIERYPLAWLRLLPIKYAARIIIISATNAHPTAMGTTSGVSTGAQSSAATKGIHCVCQKI